MTKEFATVRIRPLRFGFLIDPTDKKVLRQVLRVNTCLWGGIFNYIIPVFKKSPARYSEQHFKTPSAAVIVNGLIEAFQPDFLVETIPGIGADIGFDPRRRIPFEAILTAESDGRKHYGIDLAILCDALYEESFQFVHRHPMKVILPKALSKRYELLVAAAFGDVPDEPEFARYRQDFVQALGAAEESVAPERFHKLFSPDTLYPLRVVRHALHTRRQGWSRGPILFYMDERSPYDIIEYWNLRAIGWKIRPLPSSWAELLRDDCERFIRDAHRPYPPPSNVIEEAEFLCSRSCSFEAMQAFVQSLKRPSDWHITANHRFPRLWEEWGRHADLAEPQVVTHATESVQAHTIGHSIHIKMKIPAFAEDAHEPVSHVACANVIESIPGGSDVIPWRTADMQYLTGKSQSERVWIGREGIIASAGALNFYNHLRLPTPFNVFSAWAEHHTLKLAFSPAGRSAEQVVKALGGLSGVRLIGHEEIIRLLDQLAHGDLELEVPGDSPDEQRKKRRKRRVAAPRNYVRETLMRANDSNEFIVRNHLEALLTHKVLKLGMTLECPECEQNSWYGIADLNEKLTCSRCLRRFPFPLAEPPTSAWAYRANGPFAVENYAQGAYCVAFAVRFLAENISAANTWIPSFRLEGGPDQTLEADFGMFIKPGQMSQWQDPILIFGECKI